MVSMRAIAVVGVLGLAVGIFCGWALTSDAPPVQDPSVAEQLAQVARDVRQLTEGIRELSYRSAVEATSTSTPSDGGLQRTPVPRIDAELITAIEEIRKSI